MKKLEIKEDLEKRFYKVGAIKAAETTATGYQIRLQEGIFWYVVGVYENRDNVLIRRNISMYCSVTGTINKKQMGFLTWDDLPEGDYFYGEKEPENTIAKPTIPTFVQTLKDKGENVITYTDKYAIVKKFVEDNGVVEEKRFYVKPDGTELPLKETTNMV